MNAETNFTVLDESPTLNRANTSGRQMTMMQNVTQTPDDIELSQIDPPVLSRS